VALVGGFKLGEALLQAGPPVERAPVSSDRGTAADVPHLAWPFRAVTRRLAQVEQDSIDDVEQNVYAYLATPRGQRPLSPDFGVEDPTFGPGLNAAKLAADIEAIDGRAHITITYVGPDQYGHMDIKVLVELS